MQAINLTLSVEEVNGILQTLGNLPTNCLNQNGSGITHRGLYEIL